MTEIKRKGSRSIKEIPASVLEQLNRGEIESANLVEFLGVDRKALIKHLLNQYDRQHYLQPILSKIDTLEKVTANTIYKAIGDGLVEQVAQRTMTVNYCRCLQRILRTLFGAGQRTS